MQLQLWILLSIVCVVSSCSTNPVTGEQELSLVSESQEIQVGEENYFYLQQAQGGEYVTDPALEAYVQRVGHHLAQVSDRPHLPYEFTVLNNSIPNAWALPGGKIGINRGMLLALQNEAELAAVLSHEIVHASARHGAKAMERAVLMGAGLVGMQRLLSGHKYEDVAIGAASVGAGLLALKYSRSAELEADAYGVKYMVAAGYDPRAAVSLQELFLKLEQARDKQWLSGLFSTHPPSEERLHAIEQIVACYPSEGALNTEQYQGAMAALQRSAPAYQDLDAGYEALLCGNAKRALFLSSRGLQIQPEEAHLYNLQGKARVQLCHYKDALRCFDRAIELNPEYFDFYLQRGQLEYQLGEYARAEEDLQKSVTLLPSADAHYLLGEIALEEGRRQVAISHFKIAAYANTISGKQARQQLLRLNVKP